MKRLLNPALSGLVVLLPTLALATMVKAETFEQMVANAPLIIRGVAGARHVQWDQGEHRINTYTEIQISEVIKGRAKPSLIVRQPGGEVGAKGQLVSGTAQFNSGDDVVLFLEAAPDEGDTFIVYAMAAGKVNIEKPKLDGAPVARRYLQGLAFVPAAGQKNVPQIKVIGERGLEELGDADRFLTRLRAAVRGGAR